jgi:2-dehydro-3-deoxy-D-arabinonate dehydratase
VTYFRSRDARMEESARSGGGDFYDRVYRAERPELFFKATPHRVVGHNQEVRIRSDSAWVVPEPELTVAVSREGRIIGYTVGNDLSCRDIEGENPLYLPQAKVFRACAALGPGLYLTEQPLAPQTPIALTIWRGEHQVFGGQTELSAMKRKLDELVAYLFRDNDFPQGCYLMTGTGIVPPDSFALQPGDRVEIDIQPVGRLVNSVAG